MNLPLKVDLNGNVAVVTGGSGILCSEMAKALAACNAKVAVCARNSIAAEKVVSEIIANGGEAISVMFDVLNLEATQRARDTILNKWGKIDILVNGAGGNSPKVSTSMEYCTSETLKAKKDEEVSFFDLKIEDMRTAVDLNFFGTLIPIQVFAEVMAMAEHGNIINISSMAALTPLTKVPMYSASKAAVSNLTQWLATHFAPVGIRVNAMAPGFFKTQQNHKLLHNDDGSYSERAKKILMATPVREFGVPQDLIGGLLYLASDAASGFVTGSVLIIDGGFSAYAGV